jgi:hypothetical protein
MPQLAKYVWARGASVEVLTGSPLREALRLPDPEPTAPGRRWTSLARLRCFAERRGCTPEGSEVENTSYAASPAGTRFGTRFSRQEPTSGQGNAGTDARFPSENRQVAVIGESPEANGVQGVAGSNPAVPMT